MPSPPTYRKTNPADQPILYLALSSPTLPLSTVHEYADTMLAQRISMVSGVAQVQIFGAHKYAVRIQLDPQARAILPSTISTSFQGTAQAFQQSLQGLGLLLLVTIVVLYIVLGSLYESFIHPLTILSGLPSAGLGRC